MDPAANQPTSDDIIQDESLFLSTVVQKVGLLRAQAKSIETQAKSIQTQCNELTDLVIDRFGYSRNGERRGQGQSVPVQLGPQLQRELPRIVPVPPTERLGPGTFIKAEDTSETPTTSTIVPSLSTTTSSTETMVPSEQQQKVTQIKEEVGDSTLASQPNLSSPALSSSLPIAPTQPNNGSSLEATQVPKSFDNVTVKKEDESCVFSDQSTSTSHTTNTSLTEPLPSNIPMQEQQQQEDNRGSISVAATPTNATAMAQNIGSTPKKTDPISAPGTSAAAGGGGPSIAMREQSSSDNENSPAKRTRRSMKVDVASNNEQQQTNTGRPSRPSTRTPGQYSHFFNKSLYSP